MKIIPVLDLKDGAVVHAREGKREQYRPLQSRLCRPAGIFELIQALITTFAADIFYIADLNAITGRGDHDRLIDGVLAFFPELAFWIDRGYRPCGKQSSHRENHLPVLGSESYRDDNIAELKSFNRRFILSLDYSASGAIGASRLFSGPEFWPDDIIVMTLDRVGSDKGPDLAKLAEFCGRYPEKNFIAAGGIRHRQDLLDLQAIGIRKALLASALHNGAIGSEDMAFFQAKKYPD